MEIDNLNEFSEEYQPSDKYYEELRLIEQEILRCGKFHYRKHPGQVNTLNNDLSNHFNEVVDALSSEDYYSIGSTCYRVEGRRESGIIDVNFYYEII